MTAISKSPAPKVAETSGTPGRITAEIWVVIGGAVIAALILLTALLIAAS